MLLHVVFFRSRMPQSSRRTHARPNRKRVVEPGFSVLIMNCALALPSHVDSWRHRHRRLPQRQKDMLRLGQHVRLTSKEVEYFTHITGFAPVGIKQLDDLHSYIKRCKRYYWGTPRDTLALHRLIDDALFCCMRCGEA